MILGSSAGTFRKVPVEVDLAPVENPAMAILRPSPDTANWSLAATAGWVALWLGTRDASYLFPGAMCAALWLQCRQRIVLDGRTAHRVGLRPVTIDLATAEVVFEGRSWWRELFFLGRSLELRDADGRRLYLESWLWSAEVRAHVVAATLPATD
jgi:hypothetical protein